MATRAARKAVQRARDELHARLILEAAERHFADHGFDGAKITDIAESSGLAMGTLYKLFPGKRDILRAIHELRERELIERAETVAAEKLPTRDAILRGIALFVACLSERPDYLRMTLREGRAWALSPALMREAHPSPAWQRCGELTARLLARGIEEGIFIEDDPRFLAKTLIGLCQIHLADWVEGGMRAPIEQIVARLQRHSMRLFCGRDPSARAADS